MDLGLMVILGPWGLLRQTHGRAGIGGFIVVRKLVNHTMIDKFR